MRKWMFVFAVAACSSAGCGSAGGEFGAFTMSFFEGVNDIDVVEMDAGTIAVEDRNGHVVALFFREASEATTVDGVVEELTLREVEIGNIQVAQIVIERSALAGGPVACDLSLLPPTCEAAISDAVEALSEERLINDGTMTFELSGDQVVGSVDGVSSFEAQTSLRGEFRFTLPR